MITDDYIMRMVKQLADAILRALNLKQEGKHEEAHAAVADACEDLLGHQIHLLERLDVPSAVLILRQWDKVKAYAALLETEGKVFESEGDGAQAGRQYRRALEVFLDGLDHGGRGDPEVRGTVARLARLVPVETLRPAHQRAVRELGG